MLDNIYLDLKKGKVYSLIGESGSGKSTLARILSGLEKPDNGIVTFENNNIFQSPKNKGSLWRKDIAMVFQDAFSSLNPKWRVNKSIGEPIRNFLNLSKKNENEIINNLIISVGLRSEDLRKYPSELSGGQLKRVAIARAISCNPKLIIFDESISGLDRENKLNILNLLMKLRQKSNISYLFITHDIEVANYISDEIISIKNGKLMEVS